MVRVGGSGMRGSVSMSRYILLAGKKLIRNFKLPYRKFFGSNAAPAPKKQSTLSFTSKDDDKKRKTEKQKLEDEDVEMKDTIERTRDPKTPENTKPEETTPRAMEKRDDGEIVIEDARSESGSPVPPARKKRGKKVIPEESEESDVQPATKRRRKSPVKETQKSTKKDTSTGGKQVNTKASSPKPAQKSDNEEKSASADEAASSSLEDDDILSEDSEMEDAPPKQAKKEQGAAEQRENIQTALKSSGNDPYPDWKAGDPVPYAALCTTFSLIEMTTKRLIILSHCSRFLRQVLRLTPDDLLPTVQLMINKLAADYAGIELGIGESLIMKAIGESTGRSLAVIKADQNEIGDLGLVAAKSRGNQPTMFKPKPLTVRGVHEGLMAIAKTQGQGSQDKKISQIKKLLSAADSDTVGKGKVDITVNKGGPSESKFLVRFLEGKLRLGLAEKTVLVALAHAMVAHETELKGSKVASTEQLAKGEAILKTVYRSVPSIEW